MRKRALLAGAACGGRGVPPITAYSVAETQQGGLLQLPSSHIRLLIDPGYKNAEKKTFENPVF